MPETFQIAPPWEWTFARPWLLTLAVPALLAFPLFLAARFRRAARLKRMVAPALMDRLAPRQPKRDIAQAAFAAAGLALCAAALARPQNAVEEEKRTASVGNIAVALDVSRSMLAADMHPNRLERAKTDIRDFVEASGEDRLGLVAFRGAPSAICPLTSDRRFFEEVLSGANEDSAPPGNTDVGAAVAAALEMLETENGSRGAIVVFSDGGDLRGGEIVEKAAGRARKMGIPVFTVGLGSSEGAEVPAPDGQGVVKDDDGKPVKVALEGETLERIARLSGGRYFPVGTGVATPQTWAGVYDAINSRMQRRETERLERRRRDIYAVCLVPGFVLLALALGLSRGRFSARRARKAAAAALLACACAGAAPAARAAVPPEAWNKAAAAYMHGDWAGVQAALADVRGEPAADFLRGSALMADTNNAPAEAAAPEKRLARLSAAAAAFRAAAASDDPREAREAAMAWDRAAAPLRDLGRDAYLTNLYAKADAEKKRKEEEAAKAMQGAPGMAAPVRDGPQSEGEMFAKLEFTRRVRGMMDAAGQIMATNATAAASPYPRERLDGSAAAASAVRGKIYDESLLLSRDLKAAPPAYTNLVRLYDVLAERVFSVQKEAATAADALDDYAPEAEGLLAGLETTLHTMWSGLLLPPEHIREGAQAQTNRIDGLPPVHDRDWQNESAAMACKFDDTFDLWASNLLAQAQSQPQMQIDFNPTNIPAIKKLSKELVDLQEKLVDEYSEEDAKKAAGLYEEIARLLPRPPPRQQQQSGQGQDQNQDQDQDQDQKQDQNQDSQNQNRNQDQSRQDQDKDKDKDRQDKDQKRQENQDRKDSGKEKRDRKAAAKEDKTSEKVKELMRRVEEREKDFEKERKNLMRANGKIDPGKDL